MNKSIPKKDDLEELYLNQNVAINKIAKKLNMSVGKVYKFIRIYGIPTRKQKDVFTAKGLKKTQEQKERIRTALKGRKLSQETIQKMKGVRGSTGVGHKKKRQDGYIAVYFPQHPKSNNEGYIMEHILIMESLLGRWLTKDEVVHHKNKKRSDNRTENLQLMTFVEHAKFHMTERHVNKRKETMTYQ